MYACKLIHVTKRVTKFTRVTKRVTKLTRVTKRVTKLTLCAVTTGADALPYYYGPIDAWVRQPYKKPAQQC